MGITAKSIERSAGFQQSAMHAPFLMPPFDIDFFVVAILGTALTLNQSLALVRKSWGGASAINFTMAAGAANNGTVSVTVTGRDENRNPITEVLTIVGAGGPSAPLQTAQSTQTFSTVASVVVTSILGTLPANNYTVGLGSVAGEPVRSPNPYRGVPATQLELTQLGTLPAIAGVTSVSPHETILIPIATTVRMACVGLV